MWAHLFLIIFQVTLMLIVFNALLFLPFPDRLSAVYIFLDSPLSLTWFLRGWFRGWCEAFRIGPSISIVTIIMVRELLVQIIWSSIKQRWWNGLTERKFLSIPLELIKLYSQLGREFTHLFTVFFPISRPSGRYSGGLNIIIINTYI